MGYIGEMKGRPDPQVMIEKYPDYLACGSYSVNEAFEALGYPKEIVDNPLDFTIPEEEKKNCELRIES